MSKIKVLLADDHPNFLRSVGSLLEPTYDVVGSVADGQALFEAAKKLKPDVIVSDISMPILNGVEAANKLRESGCMSRLVFLSIHSDADFVRACLATGAYGYVVKPRMAIDLLPAIREAIAGRIFISPHLA